MKTKAELKREIKTLEKYLLFGMIAELRAYNEVPEETLKIWESRIK
jgi:hypothetical protein